MPVALLGEATEHSQEYSQPNPGSVKSDSGRQRLDIDSASMPQHGSSEQSSEQSTTTTARRNRRWSARHTADSRSDEARHAQQMDHPITDSRALLSPQSGPEQSEEHRQTSQQVGHPSQTEALPCPSPPLPQQQQQPDPQHLYGRYLQHGYSHEIFGSQTEALNPMLSHMACVVCQQVLRDPHSCIRCGQSMCSPCLAALPVINTQAMPNVVSCPMCRQLASRAAWPANMHLRRMLGDLVVTCTERQEKKDANGPSPSEATDGPTPITASGPSVTPSASNCQCTWHGKLDALDHHLRHQCPEARFKCPRPQCHSKVRRKNFAHHLQSRCKWRPIECPQCRGEVVFGLLQRHYCSQCPNVVFSCPNGCWLHLKKEHDVALAALAQLAQPSSETKDEDLDNDEESSEQHPPPSPSIMRTRSRARMGETMAEQSFSAHPEEQSSTDHNSSQSSRAKRSREADSMHRRHHKHPRHSSSSQSLTTQTTAQTTAQSTTAEPTEPNNNNSEEMLPRPANVEESREPLWYDSDLGMVVVDNNKHGNGQNTSARLAMSRQESDQSIVSQEEEAPAPKSSSVLSIPRYFTRAELAQHLRDVCPLSLRSCLYQSFGCEFRDTRQHLVQHLVHPAMVQFHNGLIRDRLVEARTALANASANANAVATASAIPRTAEQSSVRPIPNHVLAQMIQNYSAQHQYLHQQQQQQQTQQYLSSMMAPPMTSPATSTVVQSSPIPMAQVVAIPTAAMTSSGSSTRQGCQVCGRNYMANEVHYECADCMQMLSVCQACVNGSRDLERPIAGHTAQHQFTQRQGMTRV